MTNVTVSKSVYAPFFLTTYTSINGTTPGGTAVTAAFTGGNPACGYLTVANRSLSAVSSAPPSGMNFPLGLFEFNTNNHCAGNTLNFTLEYAQALPAGAKYYKFGPEPGNTTPHWYVLSNAVITTTGNTTQVKFSVTDNGLGDSDPTVGVIADPGGVGVPDDPAAGVQSVPTLSQWGLLLLMGLLGLKGRKRVFQ
jgi:hypothetical protein